MEHIDSKNCIEDIELEELEHRFRLYTFVLYKDTTTYNYDYALNLLKSMGEWAMIEHKPEKDEKKEHVHFILRMKNAKKKDIISELTGIPVYHFKNVKSERMMLRYLIHLDDKNKIQYDFHLVETSKNYWRTFRKALDDLESEEEIIRNIYEFINTKVKSCDKRYQILYELITYVNDNCYDSIYKRYRPEFNLYLNDLL